MSSKNLKFIGEVTLSHDSMTKDYEITAAVALMVCFTSIMNKEYQLGNVGEETFSLLLLQASKETSTRRRIHTTSLKTS